MQHLPQVMAHTAYGHAASKSSFSPPWHTTQTGKSMGNGSHCHVMSWNANLRVKAQSRSMTQILSTAKSLLASYTLFCSIESSRQATII